MARRNILRNSFLAIALSGVSVLAYADLTMVNNSNRDSTAVINGVGCSSDLPGGKGITKAHTSNTINGTMIDLACFGHASDCKAEVFMTVNCNRSGASKIATVVLDTKKGIKSVSMHTNEYKITANGFSVQLDGGPALKN